MEKLNLLLFVTTLSWVIISYQANHSPLPSSSTSSSVNGLYIPGEGAFEWVADKLTEEGEWAWDEIEGMFLPEEMDDGELEGGDHHITWTYSDQEGWVAEYPECKGIKRRQSPIDIVTNATVLLENAKLELLNWDQEMEFTLKNTHHSISCEPNVTNVRPTVKLDWLPEGDNIYELQDIHFHWGDGINKGSEHEINGQKAAAEMHMVHYKQGVRKCDIGNTTDSVMVIGVMIESDNEDHNKLESIIAESVNINGTDNTYLTQHPEFMRNMLPDNIDSFFTYSGSLTTPPCYEVVTWIVMSQPVYMSNDKLVELSNIEAKMPDGIIKKINKNNRDVQPLLDRPVYVSFDVDNSKPVAMNLNNTAFKKSLDNLNKKQKSTKPNSSGHRGGDVKTNDDDSSMILLLSAGGVVLVLVILSIA